MLIHSLSTSRKRSSEGHAWWWKDGVGFISIWEDEEDDEHEPGIQLMACSTE